MKLCAKRVLSLLCAVLMVVGLIPAMAIATSAKMVGGDFPWTDKDEPMLIEQILERDGLIDGIWFPWFNAAQSGHNLTGNDLMAKYYNSNANEDWARVEMDYIGADKIYQQIYNLKAMGYNIMAYGGSIHGEGVIFNESGNVIGIKQEYLDNARRLLDMCRDIGMPVMWNVYFHCSSMPNYYGIDGWKTVCQMLGNQEVARNYAKNFVAPLCEMLAEYPDVVALVSIADEPENEQNDVGAGNQFEGDRAMYGVTQADLVYFMKQINDTVREKLPNVARTVASNRTNKTIYRDFDLDLMGHNRYSDAVGHFPNLEELITDAAPILTEYNLGWNKQTDDGYTQMHIGFREEMVEKGYKGGFSWCWMPNRGDNDDGASYYLIRSRYDVTSFRKCVTDLKYYMDEYRAEYRGEKLGFVAPEMYANYGSTGKVLFIPSKNAVSYTVQRSDDGGKTWKDLTVKNTALVDQYLVGRYTDNDSSRPKSGYCYRVIAYDKSGNAATSKPNYVAGHDQQYKRTYVAPTFTKGIYYLPTTQTKAESDADTTKLITFGEVNNRVNDPDNNLIINGSFEKASGGQWNKSSFLNDYISVVTDSTAPDGKKSLKFDTSATQEEGWYTFTVSGLDKNSDYVLSTWIKGDYLKSTNKGMASFGVIDPDTGKFMTFYEYYRGYARTSRETQQIYPTAWDKDWHLRSVKFTTGNNTTFTFALYGYGSVMWLDDVQLYKNGQGLKYTDGTADRLATGYVWTDVFADPRDSLVTDSTIDDEAYWTAGSGWRNGFMSFYKSRLKYGNALKYTGGEDSHGIYYLKSIAVKPDTDYYITFDFKILENGAGRIVLMDNQKDQPEEAFFVELDGDVYGNDWIHYNGDFYSGAYKQVNFGVCDLGGSVLIDNVRIFKKSDENEKVKDLYTYSVKTTNKVAYGAKATVEARAKGDGLTYKWYFKDKGASKFSLTTSYKTKTYSLEMNAARDGRQVYCVITDKYGISRRTETVTLSVKRSTPKITTQPKTATYAKIGDTAKVSVKASGDGLTYTWYIKNDGATKYSKSSVTSSTYSVKMSEAVHGRRLYCVVTDAWGNQVKTNTVILRRAASIVTQPKTVTVAKNKTAKVTMKAAGDGLTYTWYIKNPGQSKYTKSSCTSATYSCKMTAKISGRYVYCVVKDKYGNTVKTKTVQVKMK